VATTINQTKTKMSKINKEVKEFLNAPENNKEPWEIGDLYEHIKGGLTYDKENSFIKFQKKMNEKDFDKVLVIPQGWWLHISPLARINPEEWVVGVLRKGKASWITEVCKSKFDNSQDAYDWGIKWINEYNEKKSNK